MSPALRAIAPSHTGLRRAPPVRRWQLSLATVETHNLLGLRVSFLACRVSKRSRTRSPGSPCARKTRNPRMGLGSGWQPVQKRVLVAGEGQTGRPGVRLELNTRPLGYPCARHAPARDRYWSNPLSGVDALLPLRRLFNERPTDGQKNSGTDHVVAGRGNRQRKHRKT